MKKIFLLLTLVLIVAAAFLFRKSIYYKPVLNELPSVNNSPYTVENLKNKVTPNNTLTIEKEIAKEDNFTSYLISFYSENIKEYALMNLPNGQKPESGWPVVIINHGYIDPKNYSTLNSYKNTSAYFANQGYLILKPDYRGHDQSQGQSDLLFSRAQYAVDVLNLISGIPSLKDADSGKIFMYGHSMGGEVSLLVAENTDKIKSISLWAPAVADFPESVTFFLSKRNPTPAYLPQVKSEIQKIINTVGADKFSSLANLNNINIPVQVQQGTADESVPFSWGQNLVFKLKSANKSVVFYSYPNDDHDLSHNWSTALSRDIQFFSKK